MNEIILKMNLVFHQTLTDLIHLQTGILGFQILKSKLSYIKSAYCMNRLK